MGSVLITGALGQFGTELTAALREMYGESRVIITDIRRSRGDPVCDSRLFMILDCARADDVMKTVRNYNIGVIYHLAAILSARAEADPQAAFRVNVIGTYNILEAARTYGCKVFIPSSIGVFACPPAPAADTPQVTIQRPRTIYGVTKVCGELLGDYYTMKYGDRGADVRGIRYPGIISHKAKPGGGTTDYAVEIFHEAVRRKRYECFLGKGTRLDMIYMPDAVRAAIELMAADAGKLVHRNAYNLAAMSIAPEDIARAIRKHIPEFRIAYRIDTLRQAIADGWPDRMDDSAARQEWGWKPAYDLEKMTAEMIAAISAKTGKEEIDV